MNIKNIKKVRDHIALMDPSLFDMEDWGFYYQQDFHTCGTAACIGGWTEALMNDPPAKVTTQEVFDWLGVNQETGERLCFPRDGSVPDPYNATPANACAVLDHLMETGNVEWSWAMENPADLSGAST